MSQIYSRASRVFTSLGSAECACVHEAIRLASDSEVGAGIEATKVWLSKVDQRSCRQLFHGLNSIAYREYWNRAWVLQEFAQAKEVIVVVGSSTLSWEKLSCFVDRVSPLWGYVYRLTQRRQSYQSLGRSAMVQMGKLRPVVGLDRKANHSNWPELENLIYMVKYKHCSDPRDRIFSVLSIVDWSNKGARLEADYRLTPFQLAIQTAMHLSPLDGSIFRVLRLVHTDQTSLLEETKVWARSRAGADTQVLSLCLGKPKWRKKPSAPFRRWRTLPHFTISHGKSSPTYEQHRQTKPASLVHGQLIVPFRMSKIQHTEVTPGTDFARLKRGTVLFLNSAAPFAIILVPTAFGKYRAVGQIAYPSETGLVGASLRDESRHELAELCIPCGNEAVIAWSMLHVPTDGEELEMWYTGQEGRSSREVEPQEFRGIQVL